MNPFTLEIIGSFVRWVLTGAAGWLVAHGVWSVSQSDKYVPALTEGIALALVSLGLSIWQKYRMRNKLVTAMAMPSGVSENQVQAAIKDPDVVTPPVTLAKDETARPMEAPPQSSGPMTDKGYPPIPRPLPPPPRPPRPPDAA